VAAKRLNLEIYQRSTKEYNLVVRIDGAPEDITGWTIYFIVKEKQEDTDANAVISKAITNHTDPTNGKTTIALTAGDTDLTGSYVYGLSYLDDESNQDVLMTGRINFRKSVIDLRS